MQCDRSALHEEISDLLYRAAYLNEPTLVTRSGKAVAVLASVRNCEQYLEPKVESNMNDGLAGSGLCEEME